MNERFDPEQVRQYWIDQAIQHKQSASASWSDHMVIELEIREVVKRLADGDRVLDIGCANGYSTLQFASQKRINIRGLDYIPEMIAQARLRLDQSHSLLGTTEFDLGDITDLHEPTGAYDKVIVIRVLINLGDWDRQKRGLQECIRVLKPGGMLLLSEATLQGWHQLNKFRREWGLPDISMPSFNQYIDEDQVVDAVAGPLQLIEVSNFSSTYYVGTRVLKPLLIQALRANIDVADPNMEWNRWFSLLPAFGDYGVQKLYVFKKK